MIGLSLIGILKDGRTALADLQRNGMHGLRNADFARHWRLVERIDTEGRELNFSNSRSSMIQS